MCGNILEARILGVHSSTRCERRNSDVVMGNNLSILVDVRDTQTKLTCVTMPGANTSIVHQRCLLGSLFGCTASFTLSGSACPF